MIIAGFPRCTFTFPSPTLGTGPFTFGFNFGESTSSSDLLDVATDVAAVWDGATAFRGIFSDKLGTPTVTCIGEYAGIVDEEAVTCANAASGSDPDLSGVSARIIWGGNRPAGGRRGCMYLPMIEGTAVNANGTLTAGVGAEIDAFGTALIDAVEAAVVGLTIRTLHNVDGNPSQTVVPDCSVASTVSFLQKRYR